jgi:hypothetical protein
MTWNIFLIIDKDKELFNLQGLPTRSGEEYPLNKHYQHHHEARITGLDDLDDAILMEYEIVTKLGLDGGRAELRQFFLQGALACDTLIRSNVRLVILIAK